MDIEFTSDELASLRETVRRPSEEVRIVERARLVLAFAETGSVRATAARFGTTRKRVRRWVTRWLEGRSNEALRDVRRTGRKPQFGVRETAKVLSIVSQSPAAYGLVTVTWTQELVVEVLAREGVHVSRSTVQRILARQDIDIRTVQYWLFTPKNRPEYVSRRDAICALYCDMYELPDDELVVCFDAKPGIQLLGDPKRGAGSPGPRSGQPRRVEFEYRRMGTRSVVAAVSPTTGEVLHWDLFNKERRFDSAQTIAFLDHLRLTLAERGIRRIHLVLDNGSTHRSAATTKYLAEHSDCFATYFTPVHASWLNLCENFFSVFSRRYLRHRRYGSPDEFDVTMPLWVEDHDRRCYPLRHAPHQRAA